jgi:uridine kinase
MYLRKGVTLLITVHFSDGSQGIYTDGITLGEIACERQKFYNSPIVAANVDNRLRELSYKIFKDCLIEFLDLTSDDGVKIYTRTLTFVFIRAAKEVFPDSKVSIEHSLGKGIYCEIHKTPVLSEPDVEKIKQRMKRIIGQDEQIQKHTVSVDEAVEIFKKQGLEDKVKLMKYRSSNEIKIYSCDWLKNYFYGYMLPSTGKLKIFDLQFYKPGVVLRFPTKDSSYKLPDFTPQPKLFSIFRESEKWGEILNVENVASLNRFIETGKAGELIRISEALHEKKIIRIADTIYENRNKFRVILIAGPSSSGKTTFAQRLAIQLKVDGLRPVSISLDDYFVDREHTPKDEHGNYDFEALEAIDLNLFNDHLKKLISGQKVEIPVFNFKTGQRIWGQKALQISPDQPIIIEGIHGLNDTLTLGIPRENKFKIYISALTQLNVDSHNRIPTTDTRIIRRMVRDSQFRSNDASKTISWWPFVRRGEEKNIFPFQEDADVMFNSALVYELSVLKKYAEPLLRKIDPNSPEYNTASLLLSFLSYFVPIENENDIPNNSIIREFIGGSCFE